MKTTVIGGGLLIVIIVVVGLLVSRSSNAPVTTETPFTDEITDEESQFIQIATSPTPPLVFDASPAATPTAVSLEEDTVETVPGAAKTISIEDTGFTPATLTIPAGTTVTFINNGQAAHWPASDPHPTHTRLPGFDAKRGLSTGEQYNFTFTQKGTWGFHDHLNAQVGGTITVQ